ncbi:hypothetical protein CSHISOI_10169 [Colletotrichum shisoi]|uniref:Uncharacterized protein n=1 Tax=Colletotrichum shisoi TaxID=2078593 RepID=A0A5Q4BEH1_9PEZI|nr:hypothetical protein CSHISOI_10169 [Colletotrichum shisoi]
MKFSTTAFLALGFLAGNVVSAPAIQSNDVAQPVEVRAEGSVANDAAHLEVRARKKLGLGKVRAKGQGAAAAIAQAAKKKKKKKNGAAAAVATEKDAAAKKEAAAAKKKTEDAAKKPTEDAAKKPTEDAAEDSDAAKKNNNNNNNNNNGNGNDSANNNANAGKPKAKSQADFQGLACTDGKGAGSCNATGQCAVNGKTAEIAGQCGFAAAAAKKAATKRYVSNKARVII